MLTSILQASLPLSMPIVFAAVGETYAERAGVLNLGIEGIMGLAAFVALWTTFLTGSYPLGILTAMGAALALGLLHTFATVRVGVNQLIMGLLIYTVGGGIADFSYRLVISSFPSVRPLAPVQIPLVGDSLVGIPFIGPALFQQNALVYLSLLVALVLGLALYKTTWGLKVRSVGENPEAADAAGINVNLTRHLCVLLGAALAGLAGASITLGYVGLYTSGDSTIAGRGWIAIVVVIFARWSPYRAILGSWVFGLGYAISAAFIGSGTGIPGLTSNPYFLLMLPYLFALVVILVFHRGTKPPSSLTVPYKRR
ncbi:MAG TPA: ABC transporter permease [Nitrososphaerales archaeon]|nr:ABC transporter permease [Nitrososphaerales archaeon]